MKANVKISCERAVGYGGEVTVEMAALEKEQAGEETGTC